MLQQFLYDSVFSHALHFRCQHCVLSFFQRGCDITLHLSNHSKPYVTSHLFGLGNITK